MITIDGRHVDVLMFAALANNVDPEISERFINKSNRLISPVRKIIVAYVENIFVDHKDIQTSIIQLYKDF